MNIRAVAQNIGTTPRKTRLVTDLIRGMDVVAARAQLQYLSKAAARPVLKLLESAIANAKHNFNLKEDQLKVGTIQVDESRMIYRYTPKARGRATKIRHRGSHITMVLKAAVEVVKPAVKKGITRVAEKGSDKKQPSQISKPKVQRAKSVKKTPARRKKTDAAK